MENARPARIDRPPVMGLNSVAFQRTIQRGFYEAMSKESTARQKAAEKRKKRELEMRRKKAQTRAAEALVSAQQARPVTVSDLPVVECVISKGWEERGLAHILLARGLPDGNLMVAGFYVDTFSLGIKDSALIERIAENEYRNTIKPTIFNDPVELVDCDPRVAKAVALGAADYALPLGFKPNKRWPEAKSIFAGIELPETPVVFGKGGKPCFVKRGESNSQAVLAKLARAVGEGNYSVEEEAR